MHPKPANHDDKARAQWTLLVAAHHPLDRSLLSAYAGLIGCAVEFTTSGRAAAEIARAQPFDALVLDQTMPDLRGLDVLRSIRADNGPNATTPALIWTSDDPRRLARAADGMAGVDAVGKPLGLRAFEAWVNAACGGSPGPAPDVSAAALRIGFGAKPR